ncbi:hypothetical protein WJX74_010808 [Apatococcus lobatus]|uniref:AMMECR1 domain-containing protein n=1 Tax=Apatococcus lobatus TaxID=904363 RepID=A0AAW1S7Y0_9CHLO
MQFQQKLLARSDHVAYCFESLLAHFSGETVEPPAFEDVSCPLFVTWNKLSRRGTYRLRGCIGTLEAKQLHQALRDYALTSALGDRRFAPVEQTEIASLKCTVSLLRCFQQAATWLDWTIGQHGLIIEFMDPLAACKRTATFLPEIPQQEGWSQQQTIDSLISKQVMAATFLIHEPVKAFASMAKSLRTKQVSVGCGPY